MNSLSEVVWHELGHAAVAISLEKSIHEVSFKVRREYNNGKQLPDAWEGYVKYYPSKDIDYCSKKENVEELSNVLLILLAGPAFHFYYKKVYLNNCKVEINRFFRDLSFYIPNGDYSKLKKCIHNYNQENKMSVNENDITDMIKEIIKDEGFMETFQNICDRVKQMVIKDTEVGIESKIKSERIDGLFDYISSITHNEFRKRILEIKRKIILKLLFTE